MVVAPTVIGTSVNTNSGVIVDSFPVGSGPAMPDGEFAVFRGGEKNLSDDWQGDNNPIVCC
ncbi:hypothetical protein [Saccharomonospora glauca]|uniref:hypothetical protein n=1 Tax=Saccharomonospora glauca TaxID=40990 RepID=UPI0012FC693C|nr:hypothetical protein [Saccharomonospora glauca]